MTTTFLFALMLLVPFLSGLLVADGLPELDSIDGLGAARFALTLFTGARCLSDSADGDTCGAADDSRVLGTRTKRTGRTDKRPGPLDGTEDRTGPEKSRTGLLAPP